MMVPRTALRFNFACESLLYGKITNPFGWKLLYVFEDFDLKLAEVLDDYPGDF